MATPFSAPLRALSALTAVAVVAAGLFAAPPAYADTAPAAGVTETVSTDPLPTVQVDGIVWSQVVVGTTVYVAGRFTTARPAGSPAGVNTTPRANVLAYDVTTGELLPGFVADTNGQVNSITATPDGSRIFIGGTFTSVNGITRYRVAALDPATGAVVSNFAPSFNGAVDAVTATNTTLYAGGNFTAVGSNPRTRGAAVAVSNGAVQPFAPVIEGGRARGIAVSPDGSKVVFGGSFTTLNGSNNPGYGMGAVDARTGASLAWNGNSRIRNGGTNSAIYSLTSDADGVYGTGYHFGAGGNIEGVFRLDWASGDIVWVADCHGDTYSSAVLDGVVYSAGHAHYCGTVGSFPQTNPWTFQRGMAFTKDWNGNLNNGVTLGYPSWEGVRAPDVLNWWPDFNIGAISGADQGPWSVAAGGDYVVYGGEFTRVNNVPQQGLVRFAVKEVAPNEDGPRLGGPNFVPTLKSPAAGVVRVSWLANYDRDNQYLTYRVIRDGDNANPVYETTAASRIWFDRPLLAYTDRDLEPGSTHTYRLRAEDPFGNVAWGDAVTVTVSSTGTLSDYAASVLDDGATNYWRLGEASGTAIADWAGVNDAVANTGVTLGQTGAIGGDPDTAASFSGTSTGSVAAQTSLTGPTTFALEAWFKTTSTTGGKIVSFGSAKTGNSGSYDRHVYLDASGRIYFGVYPGSVQTVSSGAGFNDGQWHHVVASLSSAGMELYVDGARIGRRPDVTTAQVYTGYWRIGGDSAWAGSPYLNGTIDDVAVYQAPLTLAQVREHYALSGRALAGPAAPTDGYGAAVYADQPDHYWRLNDAAASTTAADYSGNNASGVYSGGVTKPVTGIGADSAASFDGTNDAVASARSISNPRTYSLELMFKTDTTTGGKLIGFGSAQTGLSGQYDRHVYLQNDGRLVFGTYTNVGNTITTAEAYNDDKWHQVVATQSPAGMRLYVDGVLQGSNTVAGASNYTGYWRVGGDNTWGSSSAYVRGLLDEVAIYSYALSAETVTEHYQASGLAPVPKSAPTASFTSSVDDLHVTLDAGASSDDDGTITEYAWDFGDGATGTGATAEHTYASGGTYTVTLTVTDDDGATGQTTGTVTVTPANVEPTASFTSAASGLSVSVDASGSADSDGSIASYAWDFGDGATAGGRTAEHAYAEAGTYTVTLTVTDDRGTTGTVQNEVTVTAPPPPPAAVLAVDPFDRTVTGGLGSAPTGGAWTTSGNRANYSVDGRGNFRLAAGSTLTGYLGSVSSTETEVTGKVTPSAPTTSGSTYFMVTGRRIGTEEYRLRGIIGSTGSVQLSLQRSGTTLRAVAPAGLTFAAGDTLQFRLQVTGTDPTTLTAKVWKAGTAEPADWQLTATDSTAALQGPGSVGLGGYLSASASPSLVTLGWDDFWAGAPGTAQQPDPEDPGDTPPANVAPTAAFTSSTDALTASVDAAASADSDGTIQSYAWDFGDGTTGTGVTASRTYGAAGTYTVTLTVTDDDGATATSTGSVTVTAPAPPPQSDALASDDFARESGSGWGEALTGGAWTTTPIGYFSTDGSVGRISIPTAGRDALALLDAVAGTDTDTQVTVSLQTAPTGGGVHLALIGRRVGGQDYRANVVVSSTGAVALQVRGPAGVLAARAISGLTLAPGEQLRIRLQVVGQGITTLRAKVWKAGTPEPTDWQVTGTDTTAALQTAGSVGIYQYLSGSATSVPITVTYDDLIVVAAG